MDDPFDPECLCSACTFEAGAMDGPFDPECLCSVCTFEAGAFNFSRTADEGAVGARCDFRLLCSIMLTAQASRSTGVRFAA
jgi:hypothetical protein